MDLTVILGMLGALASIAIGDLMEGGNPSRYSYNIINYSYSNCYVCCCNSN